MVITITARHLDVTDAIRSYVQKKVEKLTKFEPKITEVHIVITVEKKYRHIVEINLHSKQFDVIIKEETDDTYSAIDNAIERISKLLRRHRDKLRSSKRRGKAGTIKNQEGQEDYEE